MNRSTLPPDPEMPKSTVSALHALYHEAAGAEPDPVLDKGILDAARAEVRAGRAGQRKATWWKGWLTAASAVAIAVVGLSVTWRVMDQQERHLREEIKAAEGDRENAAVTAASPLTTEPAAASAMAPAPVDDALKKGRRAETDERLERRDLGAAMEAAPGSTRQMDKPDARSTGNGAGGKTAADVLVGPSVGSSVKSLAAPTKDVATPEAWLKHIRELRAAGRSVDAVESLSRFRARYPDIVLPDDLINFK